LSDAWYIFLCICSQFLFIVWWCNLIIKSSTCCAVRLHFNWQILSFIARFLAKKYWKRSRSLKLWNQMQSPWVNSYIATARWKGIKAIPTPLKLFLVICRRGCLANLYARIWRLCDTDFKYGPCPHTRYNIIFWILANILFVSAFSPQLWEIEDFECKDGCYKVCLNYCGYVTQRLVNFASFPYFLWLKSLSISFMLWWLNMEVPTYFDGM